MVDEIIYLDDDLIDTELLCVSEPSSSWQNYDHEESHNALIHQ